MAEELTRYWSEDIRILEDIDRQLDRIDITTNLPRLKVDSKVRELRIYIDKKWIEGVEDK